VSDEKEVRVLDAKGRTIEKHPIASAASEALLHGRYERGRVVASARRASRRAAAVRGGPPVWLDLAFKFLAEVRPGLERYAVSMVHRRLALKGYKVSPRHLRRYIKPSAATKK
jgi:hypothetical protein